MQPRKRQEPTTTETEGADILLLRQVQGPRQSFGPCVCGRMTSHANSPVGCFSPHLLFSLVVFAVAVVLSVETEELGDERVPLKKKR